MKRKYAALLLGVTVCTVSMMGTGISTVFAETEQSQEAAMELPDQAAGKALTDMPAEPMMDHDNMMMGEVIGITEDSITIQKKSMGRPGENTEEDNTEETTTIQITEDTVITKKSMGGNAGGPGQNINGVPDMPRGGNGRPDGDNGAPEKPDGESGERPEKPDGESGEAPERPEGENGEAPERPDGENGQGQPGGAPGFSDETISLEDIEEGDMVMITLDDDGNAASITLISMDGNGGMGDQPQDMEGNGGMGGQPQGMGQPGGQSGVDNYEAAITYDSDTETDGETYASTGTDENAVLVTDGASVTLSNATITRDSEDSTGGDNSSFYGVGAAVLAEEGTVYVDGGTVTTDAAGGAGLFAYGDGVVYAKDTTITTTQGTSGGVHAAGGGTLYGWNLTAETSGNSSAAIRSDRGGGTMVIDGGSYTSNGSGSPAIYSTADITVNDADLTATGSEAICIEGRNSLHLFDCNLSGNMPDQDVNDCTWNVILYQSMSGDSEVGNSTFEMNGGTLTAENGGMFYTTNTESTFTISNVDITYAEENDFFLKCTGNSNQRGWGQSGANGADCVFTARSQEMEGNVIWDSISALDFYILDGSSLAGAVVNDESNAGNGGDGYCTLVIDEDSSWTVTGDSTLTTLNNAGTITDAQGNTVSVVDTDGTIYVEGTSAYTITVEEYSETADETGASSQTFWSDYAAELPEELA